MYYSFMQHGAGFQGGAKLFIEYGIHTLDVHSDGYIPMHRACWGQEDRHTDTVRVFLEAGVPVRNKAENGKACWQMTKNKETKKLSKTYTAKLAPKSQEDLQLQKCLLIELKWQNMDLLKIIFALVLHTMDS